MLKARILSALALIAVVLSVLLWAPPGVTVAVIALAMLVCAWEWSAFLRPVSGVERAAFMCVTAGLGFAAWRLSADLQLLRALLWIAAAWWLVALLLIVRGPAAMGRLGAWLSGLCVLVPAGVALARLRVDLPAGEYWVLYVLALVWAADTGAFFAGRAFGRRRLAPQVSPGKTWEGVAGGMVFAGVAAALAAWRLAMPAGPMIAIGMGVAAFSVVGDLTESLLKRYSGLKDSGQLIPGHGGLMDRLDSATAAAPLLLLCVIELLPVRA